jgi:hypothetical protein
VGGCSPLHERIFAVSYCFTKRQSGVATVVAQHQVGSYLGQGRIDSGNGNKVPAKTFLPKRSHRNVPKNKVPANKAPGNKVPEQKGS